MSDWESRVNLALRELNQAQVSRRIAPQDYRRCRRQLLLKAIHFSGSADTLRRSTVTKRGDSDSQAMPRLHRERGSVPAALRSRALWLWGLCMVLGAIGLYWYRMKGGVLL